MSKILLQFLRREDGPTAVEYAVLLALIVLVAIGGIKLFGEKTNESFNGSGESITTYISNANGE
jgi:pilus assembly protein Flp/PilA